MFGIVYILSGHFNVLLKYCVRAEIRILFPYHILSEL